MPGADDRARQAVEAALSQRDGSLTAQKAVK
jgi:hypothetical protein